LLILEISKRNSSDIWTKQHEERYQKEKTVTRKGIEEVKSLKKEVNAELQKAKRLLQEAKSLPNN